METLTIKVKGIDTIGVCIVPDNSAPYTDTIIKNFNYSDTVQKSIKVVNQCGTAFSLSAITLFEQSDAFGSTFKATIDTTNIPANATVNIPVKYNGIYKGNDLTPAFTFMLNGRNIQYNLTVTVPDTVGVISNFTKNKNNRENYVFKTTDFTSHYSDVDGDTIQSVSFSGNVASLRYNNILYVENTEIPLSDIGLGKLKHVAPLQNAVSNISFTYKVKDSKNNIIV